MHPNANTMSTNELNMDETEQIEINWLWQLQNIPLVFISYF